MQSSWGQCNLVCWIRLVGRCVLCRMPSAISAIKPLMPTISRFIPMRLCVTQHCQQMRLSRKRVYPDELSTCFYFAYITSDSSIYLTRSFDIDLTSFLDGRQIKVEYETRKWSTMLSGKSWPSALLPRCYGLALARLLFFLEPCLTVSRPTLVAR